MKKKLLIVMSLLLISLIAIFIIRSQDKGLTKIEKLKQQHISFLENSPYRETQKLSKPERKKLGLPPNAYNEQRWELTMNPSLGRPTPEVAIDLQETLIAQRGLSRGVGGDNINPWVNRGPNNQGGRTRGIMFDPNDINNANPADDYTRVFAGGVSGGLWVNEDITDADESWVLVPGIQANISVTVIVSDPNDPNKIYVGSGEPYIGADGAVIGRGVWRSLDAGATWENVIGGYTGVSNGGQDVDGIFYVSDIVARNNEGVTELYASFPDGRYVEASTPNNFLGRNTRGLYKSTDDGDTWSRFDIQFNNGDYKTTNDIELDINNNIWVTTTSSSTGQGGGDIYRSTDGITFDLIRSLGASDRTELEPSPTNPNVFWVAGNINGGAALFITTDAFETGGNISLMNEPEDVDQGIPPTDYTRGQAFYDLPIEADENGKLYVGGIDLFVTSSPNSNASWSQISKWSNNNDLNNLQVPLVHADQHAIVFRPGSNGTQVLFGNDGGVYYADNIDAAIGSSNAIQSRNKDYNTTQFYYGSIDTFNINDNLAGGTQDNGSQFVNNAADGANGFFDPLGGDGGFTEFGTNGDYVITSYPNNTHVFLSYPSFTNGANLSTGGGGSFINQATLDKNLDILYVNASSNANGIAIERISDFTPGGAVTANELLTSADFNSTPSALKISPFETSSSTLYVGLRSGRLLKANSANLDNPVFTRISSVNFVGSISDIEFGQNENEIFVTMYNYGVESIWFTNDGGTNWISIEGNLPDLPVNCILQNPLIPQELIVGTELGVWATPDYTVTNPVWIQVFNGMSDVTVTDLDLRPLDNTILASTFGRGLFTSQFTAQSLSVLESEFDNNLVKIFPTISNGNITIKSEKDLGDAAVEVYNLSGQKVYNTNLFLSTSNSEVNLNLNTGIYFINISVDNYAETKKIIIK